MRIGDRLFSGSINLNSVLEARVEKLYNDSTAAKIMRLVESANENKSESVHFVDKFTKYYTPNRYFDRAFNCHSPAYDVCGGEG